jgi:hypothetical protein
MMAIIIWANGLKQLQRKQGNKMARYTFFSFAYDDVKNFKANVVRNSWLLNQSSDTFVDGSIWEKEKSKGATVIKNLIDIGLKRTSVTTVLIGEGTSDRRWVKYEIVKSFDKGNGFIGVHLNRIKGKEQAISARGLNPFERLAFQISEDGKKINFYELVNRKWIVFADLPDINNKKSNTLYFEDSFLKGNDFGKSFRFSDKFKTYCWVNDSGFKNISTWVENAAEQAER